MSLPLDFQNQIKSNKMRLAYLYTASELTPWKENVNEATLNFLMAHTPANIEAEVVHFDGFNEELLERLKTFDLVFNLSYGYLDAGQVEVAGWLEYNGILHTASTFEALTKAQNKSLLPDICASIGGNTPAIFTSVHELQNEILYLSKPRKGSCHRDITIQNGAWMKNHLITYDQDLIVQPYITGREFSVAVIPAANGQYYMALPPVEIVPESGSEIYVAGQSFGKTNREFSPSLSDYQEDQLMIQAELLHKVIGLKGMSRTDFRMSTNGDIFVLDVNAMPNMDPEKSLMPALCEYHEIAISDLIQRMIKNHEFTQTQFIKSVAFQDSMMSI
jgi:D-alanine-D-alanine ligase